MAKIVLQSFPFLPSLPPSLPACELIANSKINIRHSSLSFAIVSGSLFASDASGLQQPENDERRRRKAGLLRQSICSLSEK